ncbi:winged helix-turn-helix transcriptional regulator [Actinomadura madurae]|uniref:winged helix-turn-helix transcriptional regulator n=1 Tax=Actinomadura madurae TaxID=1993 RepID=UPI0020D21A4E|nr:winged helix-turn-helix transcriptional regulator [Actinomadura madurae]MCP9965151.1 winged helix-turn-helix transcriptional regulator [Actinomadura madurae]MCQ0013826.1 winged helix-turn-helix transcriptional regulator [Actinomadura madurae]
MGRYNRAVVLDQIQLADGISRAEIAERTGLTPQTVSGITRKLLDEGIVREDGSSRVEGLGKPRTTLRINSDAGSAVGLHFDPVELACVVVDLVGHPLVLKRRPTPAGARPDEVVAAMADLAATSSPRPTCRASACSASASPAPARSTRTAAWWSRRPSSPTGRGCR